MNPSKNYVVDTNVLLDDPESLLKLRNGHENRVFVPYHVLMELNKFKKNPRLGPMVSRVIDILSQYPREFQVLTSTRVASAFGHLVDQYILDEILQNQIENPILVTNDRMFQLQAALKGVASQVYRDSMPFKSEAEHYTGFIADRNQIIPNAFMWNEQGKPLFFGPDGEKVIDYQHRVWSVAPRNIYQNLALELMTHPDIHVVSIQSDAGYGKSFLALASALYLTLEKKEYSKVYVVKPMIEIGQKLGYLPGNVDEKMAPYTRYIMDLVMKLHRLRSASRLFVNAEESLPKFDPKRFELLPLTFVRGMNIENAVVIVDEMQNMSRSECRTILSRMGEGVKCLCLGDIRQVDNPYLNRDNNGFNWVVNRFKGSPIYAHLMLKGDRSRGPITDLVIRSGL